MERESAGQLIETLAATQGRRIRRLIGSTDLDPILENWLQQLQINQFQLSQVADISPAQLNYIIRHGATPRSSKDFLQNTIRLFNLSEIEQVVYTEAMVRNYLEHKGPNILGQAILTPERFASRVLRREVSMEEYDSMRREFFTEGIINAR